MIYFEQNPTNTSGSRYFYPCIFSLLSQQDYAPSNDTTRLLKALKDLVQNKSEVTQNYYY